MKLWLAIKAFMAAWQNPERAEQLLQVTEKKKEREDPSHLRLLVLLQQDGRLIDFFKEDITSFSDAQVGAAVRKIHQDCSKSLEELVTIRPLMSEAEGATITVASGYNPAEYKIVGKVKGEPPYTGKLVHRGWKAHKRSLPKCSLEQAAEVLAPAEVEVR